LNFDAIESRVTLWWNWFVASAATFGWFEDEMLDTEVVDATSDELYFELGVEAALDTVELGGSGALRSFKVVGLFARTSLDVDASDDEFSNISLISFIFWLFAHFVPFIGLRGVC
jgi:hypothetical protein